MDRRTMATIPAVAAFGVMVLAGCAASGPAGSTPAGGLGSGSTGEPTTAPAGSSAPAARSAAESAPAPSAGGVSSTAGSHLTESNPPGDIPDTQVFVPFTPPGAHFSVSVPEGWARSVVGTTVRFTDKLNTITMEEFASGTAPTTNSVALSAIPDLRRQVPAFAPGGVTTTVRAAGPAVLVTFTGDSAPDPVTNKVVRDAFERYAFWHNGREAVLILSGPTNADNVDPWKTVTDSLRWR
jgi:hypothetical protein